MATITVIYAYAGNDTEFDRSGRIGDATLESSARYQEDVRSLLLSEDKELQQKHVFLIDPVTDGVSREDGIFTGASSNDYEIMDRSRLVQTSTSDFPINEADVCVNGLFLLIVVCSAVENVKQRNAIRETWGNVRSNQNTGVSQVAVVFLLGKHSPASVLNHSSTTDTLYHNNITLLQEEVKRESDKHNDVLQGDFVDSYHNLTIKSVYMLKWAQRYCSQAKFVLKTDDDMFVNVNILIKDLSNIANTRFIMGHIIAAAQPMRQKSSKWFTPAEQYSGTWYPTYISGSAYVFSGDIIDDLYNATKRTKLLWLEDVYITGLCAKTINANHLYNGKFGYLKRVSNPCIFKHVITGHRMKPWELYNIWKHLQNKDMKCDYTKISLLSKF